MNLKTVTGKNRRRLSNISSFLIDLDQEIYIEKSTIKSCSNKISSEGFSYSVLAIRYYRVFYLSNVYKKIV